MYDWTALHKINWMCTRKSSRWIKMLAQWAFSRNRMDRCCIRNRAAICSNKFKNWPHAVMPYIWPIWLHHREPFSSHIQCKCDQWAWECLCRTHKCHKCHRPTEMCVQIAQLMRRWLIFVFILLFQSVPRVKFALDSNQTSDIVNENRQQSYVTPLKTNGVNTLQRSKSLSSADALARGIAGLGLGIGHDTTDIGSFKPEIQAVIEQALIDPNQLNARSLMELANQIMQRAVEGRR